MLDEYCCLVLPGTFEDVTNYDNKVQSKWSYCNHELLWIVTNKKTTSSEGREFIEKGQRYASVRNKYVDFMVDKINRYSGSLHIDDDWSWTKWTL